MYEWELMLLFISLAEIYASKTTAKVTVRRKRAKCQHGFVLEESNGNDWTQGIDTPAIECFASDGGLPKDISFQSELRLTRSIQQLVRSIICDDPGQMTGRKPTTSSETRVCPYPNKSNSNDIVKLASFLKSKAMQANVRRNSTASSDPKTTTRRRKVIRHKNVNNGRYAELSRLRDEGIDRDSSYFDRSLVLLNSPFI